MFYFAEELGFAKLYKISLINANISLTVKRHQCIRPSIRVQMLFIKQSNKEYRNKRKKVNKTSHLILQ